MNLKEGIISQYHATLCICKKLALSSPTNGGRSVGIVRSRLMPGSYVMLCNISVTQSDMGYERPVTVNVDEVTSIPKENSKST
jgi:hypothetical protein